MTEERPAAEASVSYVSDDHEGRVAFCYRFQKEAEITGFSKLHLYMSTDKAVDMDVFVRVNKLDAQGKRLFANYTNVYSGPNGRLRASLRKVDPGKSGPLTPYHPYDTREYFKPFEVVELDIGIWPTGLRFHPGEQLEVEISGFEIMTAHMGNMKLETVNRGEHTVHSGGAYESYLLLPFIPEA